MDSKYILHAQLVCVWWLCCSIQLPCATVSSQSTSLTYQIDIPTSSWIAIAIALLSLKRRKCFFLVGLLSAAKVSGLVHSTLEKVIAGNRRRVEQAVKTIAHTRIQEEQSCGAARGLSEGNGRWGAEMRKVKETQALESVLINFTVQSGP